MKISKVSTGDKLTPILNFEDLNRGDVFYIYNMGNNFLYLLEMDSIKKGAKTFSALRFGFIINYNEVQSIKKYDKQQKYYCTHHIDRTDIPLYFEKCDGELSYIYSTSLELINILLKDKKELVEEIAKGNIVKQ